MVDIPRLPQASGNRMLQNLKDFNSMPLVSKIEYLRTTAKFYHPVEKRNHYITTTLEDDRWETRTSMCKEYTAPRNREDSRPHASVDASQEFGPILNIEIVTVIDVPGSEVQVPSLTTPGCFVWILMSRRHERCVNEIHRHNSNIVNYSSSLSTKEENFDNVGFDSSNPAVVNHEQGSQDSNNVETKDESLGVLRETVASRMRVNPASSKSSSDGSGGSSNPMSIHRRTKSIHTKKEIPKKDRIWTTNP